MIYPNPAHKELFIENPGNESTFLNISDVYGRKLSEIKVPSGKIVLNVSDLKPGIYILRFNNRSVYRIIIE